MPHGKICYLEIPANRPEDSARFYSEIFGWEVRQRGDGKPICEYAGETETGARFYRAKSEKQTLPTGPSS